MLKKICYLSLFIFLFGGINVTLAKNKNTSAAAGFAYGIKIDNPGKDPVLRFPMPEKVYQQVQHANLSDVAIFDGNGEQVPFQILASQTDADVIRKNVDFFPIFSKTNELPQLSANMLTKNGKTEIKLSSTNNENTTKIIDYIIPLAELKDSNLKELELIWKKSNRSWIAEVTLWVSNDLQDWQRIPQRSMSIANLGYAGKMLVRNIVPIGVTLKHQYLLVRWEGKAQEIDLERVYAITSHTKAAENQQIQVLPARERLENNALEYQLAGFYPVSQVNLIFKKPNRLSNAVFFSKSGRKARSWQYRGSGFFYLLKKDGAVLENRPIPIARDTSKLWKVSISDRTKLIRPYPSLKIYWVPDDVVFVAQGQGPYTLAYGSAVSNGSQNISAIQNILKQYQSKSVEIPQAVVGDTFVISGEAALKTTVEWREILLWVILVMAALLVLWMIYLLKREMKSPPK